MAPIPTNIWQAYVAQAGSGTATSATQNGRQYYQLYCNGRTLNYAVKAIGNQPSDGYPLYVGFPGGGTETDQIPNDNDSSWWDAFDRFYGVPVATRTPCLFVAARGVSAYAGTSIDTYDLHSQPESYVLLQRMIMNLMLPKPTECGSQVGTSSTFINPNKVYLLGFSAGGNGIFQLSTKISDRCAAVVAGGGHPEGATFENLANLPIRIQVGGNDQYWDGSSAYHPRPPPNLVVDTKLAGLQTFYKDTTLYPHKTDIVQGGDHASWAQPDQYDSPHNIYKTPNAFIINNVWTTSGAKDSDATSMNINPEAWVAPLSRNPIPTTVIWNLNSRPPTLGTPGPITAPAGKDTAYQSQTLFYWLCIRDATSTDYNVTDVIHASYGKATNNGWIKIQKPAAYLGFLLNSDMVDFSKNVIVYDWNDTQLGTVSLGAESSTLQNETLKIRGDPKLTFSKMVYLQSAGGAAWTVKTADSLVIGH